MSAGLAALLSSGDLSRNLQNPHKVRLSSTLNVCNPVGYSHKQQKRVLFSTLWRVRPENVLHTRIMASVLVFAHTYTCAHTHTPQEQTVKTVVDFSCSLTSVICQHNIPSYPRKPLPTVTNTTSIARMKT